MINPPTPDMNSPSEFVKAQINKPPEDSKKWMAVMFGAKGLAIASAIGAAIVVLRPAAAANITSILTIFIPSWSGMIALYLGAQGTVEYKATAAIQSLNENKTDNVTVVKEDCVKDGKLGDVRPWSPVAND